MYSKLVLNLLCTWGWPWISGPASTSCMLGSQCVPARSLYMVPGIEPRTVCKVGECSINFRHACTLWFSWFLGSLCFSRFSLCSVFWFSLPTLQSWPAVLPKPCWDHWGTLFWVLQKCHIKLYLSLSTGWSPYLRVTGLKTEAPKCWPSFIWSANANRIGLMPEGVR